MLEVEREVEDCDLKDKGVLVPLWCEFVDSRVRMFRTIAASAIERWKEILSASGGVKASAGTGSSFQVFRSWVQPLSAPFASRMLSCRSLSWPEMKAAFVESPVHRVASTTSKQALMSVRASVSCSNTSVLPPGASLLIRIL